MHLRTFVGSQLVNQMKFVSVKYLLHICYRPSHKPPLLGAGLKFTDSSFCRIFMEIGPTLISHILHHHKEICGVHITRCLHISGECNIGLWYNSGEFLVGSTPSDKKAGWGGPTNQSATFTSSLPTTNNNDQEEDGFEEARVPFGTVFT